MANTSSKVTASVVLALLGACGMFVAVDLSAANYDGWAIVFGSMSGLAIVAAFRD